MALNIYQNIAKKAYCSGEFSYVKSADEYEADQLGDGLFKYVMNELSTDGDLIDKADGVRRLENAISELKEVRDALDQSEVE